MFVNLLATLAAPSGVLVAIDRRARDMGWGHAELLRRAGVTEGDWYALETELAAVDASKLRKLLNAVQIVPAMLVSPVSRGTTEGPDGVATDAKIGGHFHSHYGDVE